MLAPLAFAASCGVLRKADGDFYANYSKKLGVTLTGKEDKKLIEAAARWLGAPYKYGGTAPSGVDCSGLIVALHREAHNAAMAETLAPVGRGELRCGDVVFFTIKEKKMSHAGMYLASGKFIHASSSQGVRINSLEEGYWKKYYAGGARRRSAAAPHPAPPPPSKPSAKPKPAVKSGGAGQKVADDVIIVFDEDF